MTEGRPFISIRSASPRRGDALPFAAGPPGPKAVLTGCQQIANGVRVHVLGSVAVNCGGTQAVATGDGAEGEGVREQFGLDRCALRMGTCCAWPRHPSTLHQGRLAGLRMPTGLPRPGFYRCPAPCRTKPDQRERRRSASLRLPCARKARNLPCSVTVSLRFISPRDAGASAWRWPPGGRSRRSDNGGSHHSSKRHADDRAADGNSRNICTQGAPRVSVGCRGFSRITTSARRAGERGRWYAMGVSNRLTANV